jgi:hypothetical protein
MHSVSNAPKHVSHWSWQPQILELGNKTLPIWQVTQPKSSQVKHSISHVQIPVPWKLILPIGHAERHCP